ncbi:chromogranin-A isoform X2 [Electrophorus electricus]|uniref:chromogranin-A isoform X2 n=1 Tax=Electrophorus electricus TaxID=8005 RepID=UPI000F09B55E|nr:chromogranin-A isoform X2 [Electrophorus electricus]
MIARGYVIFVILAKYVFSIPVSPSHVDHADVKVIKCIVEVLTDALSKPHSIPVSQGCRETLMTDDRLVTILRHHNFLQELQDIAAEGANERTEKQVEYGPNDESQQLKDLEGTADQSMLVAMERPRVGAEKVGAEEREEREQESGEHNEIPVQEEAKMSEEIPHSMISEKEREEDEGKQAITKKEENKEEQEKHSGIEEEEDEGAGPDVPDQHTEAKKSVEEENQDEQKLVEKKTVVEEAGLKRWGQARQLAHKRAELSARSYDQQEVPHHSKEASELGEEVWKSPEEQDLQMMARRDPEDRREEEGSASKKTEEGEIEGLAAIESELESVAQKLHELRRG